jgi:hypothetical protein
MPQRCRGERTRFAARADLRAISASSIPRFDPRFDPRLAAAAGAGVGGTGAAHVHVR